MSTTRLRYAEFPDVDPQHTVGVRVLTHARHRENIAQVETVRRRSRAEQVWVALTLQSESPADGDAIRVELVAPDGKAWPCGQLSEGDRMGWHRLLHMRAQRGVIWMWPASIVGADTGDWGVVFYA